MPKFLLFFFFSCIYLACFPQFLRSVCGLVCDSSLGRFSVIVVSNISNVHFSLSSTSGIPIKCMLHLLQFSHTSQIFYFFQSFPCLLFSFGGQQQSIVQMQHILKSCSPVDLCLVFLHFLAIMNTVALKLICKFFCEHTVTETPGVWSRSCCLPHRKPVTETKSIAKEEGFNWVLQLGRWELSLKSLSLTN